MLESYFPGFGTPAAAVIALLVALYLGPRLIQAARRYDIVDRPSTALKTQLEPVPYLGGLVVFLSFLLAVALTFPFDNRVLAILLMSSLVVAVGLVDDLGTLIPRDKLIGQIIAGLVLVKAGVKIEIEVLPFPADEILSVLWLVTCMNAYNIVDVSDGLATRAGLVGSGGFLLVAAAQGDTRMAILAAAMFGSLLGFLRFNQAPARMYLGDTGAMLLGAVLGALALQGKYSAHNDVSAFFVPLTLLAIPLFDLTLVVLSRWRSGKTIYHGSRDHFAVRLRDHGVATQKIAHRAMWLGIVVALAGVGSIYLENQAALLVAGGTTLCGLIVMAWVWIRFPSHTES